LPDCSARIILVGTVELRQLCVDAGFLEHPARLGEQKMRDAAGRQMADADRALRRRRLGTVRGSQQ